MRKPILITVLLICGQLAKAQSFNANLSTFGDGATSSLPVVVNNTPPTPVITINGLVLHSDAPEGNQWYDHNGLIPGATNQEHTALQSGYYYVIVTLLGVSSAPSNFIDVKVETLAVKLVSFTGKRQNYYNLLAWTTASESGNMHFEIERSGNAISFATISSLPGTGDISSSRNYQIRDENPLSGINFYRLKMVDPDGKFEYSKMIAIRNGAEHPLTIFPNPVKDELFLNGSALSNEKYQITNSGGQIVLEGTVSPGNSIPVFKLVPGIYYFKIETSTLKFLKQ